jgi:hypothetical protein
MGLDPMVSIDRNEPRSRSDFNLVRVNLGEPGSSTAASFKLPSTRRF